MDLLKNTNPILKELALHTLVHFKTSSLLNVSIVFIIFVLYLVLYD